MFDLTEQDRPHRGDTLISVLGDIGRMRPQTHIAREMNPVHLSFEEASHVRGHFVVRNKDAVVIRKGNKVAIEKPVDYAGQRYTILHDIGPTVTHSPDKRVFAERMWISCTSGFPPK